MIVMKSEHQIGTMLILIRWKVQKAKGRNILHVTYIEPLPEEN